jgi:hypothetical protein
MPAVAPVTSQRRRRLGAGEPRVLEELRHLSVTLATTPPGQGLVGHIPDQTVLESELLLTIDDRRRLPMDEVTPFQSIEESAEGIAVPTCRQGSTPEDASHHRRIHQQPTLLAGQCIETGHDAATNGRGQR